VGYDINVNIYPHDAALVFFGHYWLEDKFPVFQTANVIGKQVLDNGHFVLVS